MTTKNAWGQIMNYRLFLLIFLLAVSCKKDQVAVKSNEPLSKNAYDFQARLDAIKQRYYDQKLQALFLPKVQKGITWQPNWVSPRLEIVNDSVSYVFYPMIGTVKINGKTEKVHEIGAATFLMVKNEKDFYKAFY